MEILWGILIFNAGIVMGFLLRSWIRYRASYNGALLVDKEAGKTVYSLVLDDYPEKLEFKKEVILKVVAYEENSDRS